MENPAFRFEYEKLKRDAWTIYKNIGRPWCPALNDFVVFSRVGFQHLIRLKNIERARSEQVRRFLLLAIVKDAIEDPRASVQFQRKPTVRIIKANKKRISVPSYADFWEFTVRDGEEIIKVIVRQFPGGQKHFLSVYRRKRKSPPS
ncbi:MAG TPA: hypothetical protein VMA75_04015 [Candidatus Paceibacterota bacterium]|nr:hypothetical protein [Candidatus Paceibacterota bacterium]